MLKDKKIIIGVTGGIAAYKIASLVSRLRQDGADVHVVMTENACKFITPLTFETLSGNQCVVDTFQDGDPAKVRHVELAKHADLVMVAPATANFIAKTAAGIADDMLTTTFIACDCPKYVVPAMNTKMYENPITQSNVTRLKKYGIQVIESDSGYLACGDTGSGRMPESDILFDYIERHVSRQKDMAGKRVLVTAGACREALDPVRFLSNRSTGKMGFAMAKECMLRGADVILVKAYTQTDPPPFCRIVEAESAADMFREVTGRAEHADMIIMAAAVSDFAPVHRAAQKIKKTDNGITLEMKRTLDILGWTGEHRVDDQYIIGFSMETENLLENSKKKLETKNVDMIIANSIVDEGTGFGVNTNLVTLITNDYVRQCELMSKADVAKTAIDTVLGVKS